MPDQNSSSRYLTEFQRKLLENRLAQADLPKRHRRRIRIMLLADEGKSQTTICKLLGCCHATVRHWILIAQSGQAHTWLDQAPPGRPKTVHDTYLTRLRELVEHSPRDYGYPFRRWTAAWLSKHLEKEFNIQISDRHINRLLQQMGLSTRSPSARKPKSPPTNAQAHQAAHRGAKMRAHSSRITICDLQSVVYPEPASPIHLRGKQTDLSPLDQGAKIYGAASVRDFPFFANP
ncbi:MAG: helix-turn-helix domain-containing protein [Cyanobacteria bacterium P01_C01_bin.70]